MAVFKELFTTQARKSFGAHWHVVNLLGACVPALIFAACSLHLKSRFESKSKGGNSQQIGISLTGTQIDSEVVHRAPEDLLEQRVKRVEEQVAQVVDTLSSMQRQQHDFVGKRIYMLVESSDASSGRNEKESIGRQEASVNSLPVVQGYWQYARNATNSALSWLLDR